MRPSRRLLRTLCIFLLLAAALVVARAFWSSELLTLLSLTWWSALVCLLLLALIDSCRRQFLSQLSAQRDLPGSLSLGVSNPVTLKLHNQSAADVRMDVCDWAPAQVAVQGLPLRLTVPASSYGEIHYHLKPIERGSAEFGPIELRVDSQFGLWQLRRKIESPGRVKIYPNFASIAEFDLLGHDQQVNQMGIHRTQRRGQGMEFQQLREYRQGDVMRQVDWKASARQRKLISRQYQDERDQEIIVMLDCGRRMRSKDGDLSHFDHALNAMLLLAYVALKQGDALGLLSFGASAGLQRWLAPMKGADNINALLNQVYDLQASTAPSDLLQAAQQLMERHRKRSLVVLLSNLREEDSDDLLAAVKLLSKQHLVMVASLRENSLDDILAAQVTDFDSAVGYSAAVDFSQRRRQLLEQLRARGAIVSDAVPQIMHINLVNEYLSLKRSGRI